MNKEDFIDSKMKLSKEDIIYDYYKCEEKLIEKIGIEHENYELKQENQQLKECYCNRTDCSGRIKNSRNYDSLYQKYNKQLDNWNKLRKWIVYNKHNENTEQHYLVVDYGTLLGKMNELQGNDSK